MSTPRSCPPPNAQLLKLQHRRTELDNAIRLLEEIMLIRLRRSPEVAAIISKCDGSRKPEGMRIRLPHHGRVLRISLWRWSSAACLPSAGAGGADSPVADRGGRGSRNLPLPGVQFPPDLILSARTLRHTRSHSLRHCRPCRIARHRPQTPHLQDWCRWICQGNRNGCFGPRAARRVWRGQREYRPIIDRRSAERSRADKPPVLTDHNA
jgi:hypothetical protein